MDDETKQLVAELRREVEDLRRRMTTMEQMRVADESGGGRVVLGSEGAFLRIGSLTTEGQNVL